MRIESPFSTCVKKQLLSIKFGISFKSRKVPKWSLVPPELSYWFFGFVLFFVFLYFLKFIYLTKCRTVANSTVDESFSSGVK